MLIHQHWCCCCNAIDQGVLSSCFQIHLCSENIIIIHEIMHDLSILNISLYLQIKSAKGMRSYNFHLVPSLLDWKLVMAGHDLVTGSESIYLYEGFFCRTRVSLTTELWTKTSFCHIIVSSVGSSNGALIENQNEARISSSPICKSSKQSLFLLKNQTIISSCML